MKLSREKSMSITSFFKFLSRKTLLAEISNVSTAAAMVDTFGISDRRVFRSRNLKNDVSDV